jgi:hypothetical protein
VGSETFSFGLVYSTSIFWSSSILLYLFYKISSFLEGFLDKDPLSYLVIDKEGSPSFCKKIKNKKEKKYN